MHENIRSYETLNDSARNRKRKEILTNYNKTRINIGNQHDHCMEMKEALRVQTHAEVARKLRHKCKHQCHSTCRSDIWTCIINYA